MIQARDFVDIHTHILPGSDDGAENVAEALKMVQMAWENGTRTIVLTPHYRGIYKKNSPLWHRTNFDIFQSMVHSEFPEISLYIGNEVFYEVDVPDRLAKGEVMSLNDSRYVLLEFGMSSLRSQVTSGVTQIIGAGFIPIIAHAERYAVFRTDESLADEVLEMGALIQLNADSIMGKQGLQIKAFSHKLLRDEKAHFIASDAHNLDKRPPLLQDCFLHVCKKYGFEYASRVFCANAQAVLDNRRI